MIKSFFVILLDLKKPSVAFSGALIFGPFISSDFIIVSFLSPSKTITARLGVDLQKLFLNSIDFSLKLF